MCVGPAHRCRIGQPGGRPGVGRVRLKRIRVLLLATASTVHRGRAAASAPLAAPRLRDLMPPPPPAPARAPVLFFLERASERANWSISTSRVSDKSKTQRIASSISATLRRSISLVTRSGAVMWDTAPLSKRQAITSSFQTLFVGCAHSSMLPETANVSDATVHDPPQPQPQPHRSSCNVRCSTRAAKCDENAGRDCGPAWNPHAQSARHSAHGGCVQPSALGPPPKTGHGHAPPPPPGPPPPRLSSLGRTLTFRPGGRPREERGDGPARGPRPVCGLRRRALPVSSPEALPSAARVVVLAAGAASTSMLESPMCKPSRTPGHIAASTRTPSA